MFRLDPLMPAQNYKTYEMKAPQSTHFKSVGCEEASCPNMENGWMSFINEATELGKGQAHYIRKQSRRQFAEERAVDGTTKFIFSPGQQCFEVHKKRIEKTPLFFVRGGDWRGNPRGTRPYQHKNADDWVEDFSEHQDEIATRLNRG